MLPVLHGDAVAAARHLLTLPAVLRAGRMRRLVFRADCAETYRKARNRWQPLWGDGSLEAVASRLPQAPERWLDDADYSQCLEVVFSTLMTRSLSPAGN